MKKDQLNLNRGWMSREGDKKFLEFKWKRIEG